MNAVLVQYRNYGFWQGQSARAFADKLQELLNEFTGAKDDILAGLREIEKNLEKINENDLHELESILCSELGTKEDYFKGKEALYHFIFSEKDTHLPFNTEAHIIYLNLYNKTNKKLLDLQHDFMCTDPTDMRVDVIRRSANYYKNTEEGVNKMCEISKQIFNDGKAYGFNIGEAKGIKVGEIKTYANMINNNLITLDQALSSLNMSTEEFVNLANQYKIVINCL